MSAYGPHFDRQRRPLYRPNRRIYWSKKRMACLSITDDGYTIANGVLSASVDGQYEKEDLIQDIMVNFMAHLLILVDDHTKSIIKTLKYESADPYFQRLQTFKPDKRNPRPTCAHCRRDDCHRWKAATTLTLVYRFPLDFAPHYFKQREVPPSRKRASSRTSSKVPPAMPISSSKITSSKHPYNFKGLTSVIDSSPKPASKRSFIDSSPKPASKESFIDSSPKPASKESVKAIPGPSKCVSPPAITSRPASPSAHQDEIDFSVLEYEPDNMDTNYLELFNELIPRKESENCETT